MFKRLDLEDALDNLLQYFEQNERAYLSFRQCESPMEEELLACLLKFYDPHEVLAQQNVGGGRFRLDFLTED